MICFGHLHINWYIEKSLLSTTMIEPVYVLENGQRIPYVPIEIKDHREAYAATLHVLFKHVADFHICIVKTFSKKYGIPEDDIMQTIQESDEFKHMQVDPVLHHDGLGYLSQAQQQQEPQAPQAPQAPAQQQQQEQQAPAQQQQQEPVAKKRIVKKKLPANPAPVIAAALPDPVVAAVPDHVVAAVPVPDHAPVVAVAPDPVAVPDPVALPDPVVAAVEKRKVIRKKAPIPPVAMDMTTERNDLPTNPADALTPPPNTQKKIIRKKS